MGKTILTRVMRGLLRWVNIGVAILTLMCAYGGYVDPRVMVLPAFGVLMFPLMLVIVVGLGCVDLIMVRRQALWMAGTLLLCLPPALEIFPLHYGHRERAQAASLSQNATFTLMTYNVFGFVDVSGVSASGETARMPSLECIVAVNPDIVCLQEGKDPRSRQMRKTYPEITDTLLSRYPFIVTQGSLIVMSRWPVVEVETVQIGEESNRVECVRAEIEGRVAHIINVHLQSICLTPEDKALFTELVKLEGTKSMLKTAKTALGGKLAHAFRLRAEQAHQVRELVDSLPGNVIVCGDFNDVPGCYTLRTICGEDLQNAYANSASGPMATYNKNRLLFRIDHILYRGDMRPLSTVRDINRGSDHYPLITTFEWETNKTNK